MKNRELYLAAPFALGACVVLFLGGERASHEGAAGDDRAAGHPGAVALAPEGVASADSSSEAALAPAPETPAATDSSARSADGPPGAVIGGPRAPVAAKTPPPPARRPGGSHLYDGARRRGRLPSVLDGSATADTKALQLERAEDVADKRGSVLGRIVSVDTTAIAGWAYDWNDVATVVNVDVFVDNQLVETVPASTARPSFDPQNPSNPINGRAFTCASPKVLADGDRHTVAALAYRPGSDSKRALEGSPWTYGGVPAPSGELAWASDRMVYGWATDPSQPGKPLTVTIIADGKTLGTLTTQGLGHNDEVFARARALSPSSKTVIALDGVTGPQDPNVAAAVAAKTQELARTKHYFDFPLLAGAGDAVPFDELDFVSKQADGSTAPLPGQERAALKFRRAPDDVQAFLFESKDPIAASWLQARVRSADGSVEREAARSPMQLTETQNRLPYGGITFVSGNQVSGYAIDQDVIPGPIDVDVVIDGEHIGRSPADKKFDVIVRFGGVSEPMHGFTIVPPDKYLDGKTHTIQVFGVNKPEGMNPELAGSPATFVGKRNATPYGWLDSGDVNGVSGWAYDPDAGSTPTAVEIWIDNVLWKTLAADVVRTDLVPIVAPEATHGFSSSVPETLKDGKHHTIRAYAIDVPGGPKQELAGSPKEINAQAPFIGIFPQDSPQGLSIADVISGSPGAVAGLATGDIIKAFDDVTTKVDLSAFVAWVQTKEVGEQVVFRLWRDPALPAAPAPNPTVTATPSPPLGANERLVLVTLGSR